MTQKVDTLTRKLCLIYLKYPENIEYFRNIRFNSNDSALLRKIMRKNENLDSQEKILLIKFKPVALISVDNNNVIINQLVKPYKKSIKLLIGLMSFRQKQINIETFAKELEIININ